MGRFRPHPDPDFDPPITERNARRRPAPVLPAKTPPSPPRIPLPLSVGEPPGGLDRASWQRLRTGKLVSTRTLDLHGRTAQRAHNALNSFLIQAHAEGIRCVEIITGRGTGEMGGILKRELPHWLNHPNLRPLILAATHPHSANPGSIRLLLRRTR